MNKKSLPNKRTLKKLFDYHSGGYLIWKSPTNPTRTPIGSKAGNVNAQGYVDIKIDGDTYKSHRLIWVYHNGSIPCGLEIDHINRDRTDSRIKNLRLVTRAKNQRNKSHYKNSKSGITGVYWNTHNNLWVANYTINGKRKCVYQGVNFFEACCRRLSAISRLDFDLGHCSNAVVAMEDTHDCY